MPHNESPSLTVEIIISQQRPKGNQVDKEKPTKVGSLCGPDLQLFLLMFLVELLIVLELARVESYDWKARGVAPFFVLALSRALLCGFHFAASFSALPSHALNAIDVFSWDM